MKRSLLLLYQVATGFSDTITGLLLLFVPLLVVDLLKLGVSSPATPFLEYIGVFVVAVGLACLYGATLVPKRSFEKLEVVWLLTGITRALVAVFVVVKIHAGVIVPGWMTVAETDGTLALLQFIGLARGWLRHAAA